MEDLNLINQSKRTASHIESYSKNEIQLMKFKFAEKFTRLSSFVVVTLIGGLFGLMMLGFLSLALGFALADLLGSYSLAFLIMGAIYLVIILLLFVARRMILRDAILRNIINELED